MPNWCNTTYLIKGDKKEVDDFASILKELMSMKEPYVPNGFGPDWLGCIVNRLGGDWHNVRCRGYIYEVETCDIELDDCDLRIQTSTAWVEMPEWRHFIKSVYPSFDIKYMAEEPGCEYFATNMEDVQYYADGLVGCEGIREPCNNIKEVASEVEYVTGLTADTFEELQKICADFNGSHEDNYINIYKVTHTD